MLIVSPSRATHAPQTNSPARLNEVSPAGPTTPPYTRWDLWQRILAVLVVSAGPWFFPIANLGSDLAAGSRAVLFVVVPILAWILASNCDPPRGVVDSEVDWIVSLLAGAGVFAAIVLFVNRIPTLAQLWRVEMLGPVVWTAIATSVFFGIRYAIRLWDLWVFLLACASPLPFLLISEALGGSDLTLAALCCAVAAIVVFRATRRYELRWRLLLAGVSLAIGLGASSLIVVGSSGQRTALLVAVVVGAGAVPYLVTRILPRYLPRYVTTNRPDGSLDVAGFPRLSPLSMVTILVMSVAMAVFYPVAPPNPPAPNAADGWLAASGLRPSGAYTAATGLLGPDATYTRYTESPPTSPSSAVDVITAPTRGALDDFAKAHWYDSTEPVEYQPVHLSGVQGLAVRAAHSNADTAVDPTTAQWYALTWVWQVKTGFQQVIVVVNQHEDGPLPDPVGVSLSEAVIDPLLWIARQQPEPVSDVEPATVELAERLAAKLITTAGLMDAKATPQAPDKNASRAREDG